MRFLHIADPQLGYKQYGLDSRYKDYLRVHDDIVKFAIDQKFDAVIYAGDIFEKHTRSSDLEMYLRRKVDAMQKAGIRVLGIEGNHDQLNTNSSLEICDIEPLDGLGESIVASVAGVNITGINYCPPGPELRERLMEVPLGTQVLVMHQTLSDVCSIASDISAAELADIVRPKGVKYVAMGHIHNRWQTCIGGVHIVYPGSTEMTDCDEQPEKFVYNVDMNPKGFNADEKLLGVIKVAEHPLKTRPVHRLVLDTAEEIEAVAKSLAENRDVAMYVISVSRKESRMLPLIDQAARVSGTPIYTTIHAPGSGDMKIKTFERSNASTDLKAVVEDKYAPVSDQYSLIMQILSKPQDLVEIFNNYLKSQETQ